MQDQAEFKQHMMSLMGLQNEDQLRNELVNRLEIRNEGAGNRDENIKNIERVIPNFS